MQIHNQLSACLSAFCRRDSALFITRFINLNANWFCKGLSDWGPSPVFPHWLCVCFVHLLDPGVTHPDRTASPACLSASSVALIWFEWSKYYTHTHTRTKKTHQQPGSERNFRARELKIKAQNMWIKAVGTLFVTGWIKQRMQGAVKWSMLGC